MPHDDASGDDPHSDPPGGSDAPRIWPLYVRVLAVAYVLSHPVQWAAFLLLTGPAVFLYGLRRSLDAQVLGLGLSGVACFILCIAFRWWFVRWGRKHYPPADGSGPDGEQSPAGR